MQTSTYFLGYEAHFDSNLVPAKINFISDRFIGRINFYYTMILLYEII